VPSASPPATTGHAATAVVRVDDGRIIGPDGSPLLLRGVGLGTWLLPEGYMWGFGDRAASPRQIETLVADLLGQDGAVGFWRDFRNTFITADDVALIARAGFDHVRLPINWRVLATADGAWREDGFALVDRLIGWCRAAGLLVLLDLHGAPGGQTGTNIDDSLGRPELFMDERNADLTVALWREIARRYRDEPAVLGYDLLNEPLPNEWQHRFPDQLVALYRRLTAAIRSVDPDHLIMYEGTHWATNWTIFTEVWDPSSVLQFHRYWSPTDRPGIERYLDVGRHLGLPIYMGEGGENDPHWLAAAHQLYEDCGIGWNFWTWKKIDTRTSPLSVDPPAGWDRVVRYAAGIGERPSPSEAREIFDELLANVAADRCTRRPEVLAALFRRAPVELPAYGFTFRGPGRSYGTTGARPHPGLRPDDAVTLRRRDHGTELDFSYAPDAGPETALVADLTPGDWLSFEVEVGIGAWLVVIESAAASPFAAIQWVARHNAAEAGRVTLRVLAATEPVSLLWVRVEEGR